MRNPAQLDNDVLMQISSTIGSLENQHPSTGNKINTIAIAQRIRNIIIQKLQNIFQNTITSADDIDIKSFFTSFTLADFEDNDKLQSSENYLSDLMIDHKNRFLKQMWSTRRKTYQDLVFNDAPTSLFFQIEFQPRTQEEKDLYQKQLLAIENHSQAKNLIDCLIPINRFLSFGMSTTRELSCSPAA